MLKDYGRAMLPRCNLHAKVNGLAGANRMRHGPSRYAVPDRGQQTVETVAPAIGSDPLPVTRVFRA